MNWCNIQIMNYGIGGKIGLHFDTLDTVRRDNQFSAPDPNVICLRGVCLIISCTQNLNGFQNENNWLCMKLWKLPLCAPQQSDLGIGGGRITTAMLYLSNVEVGPLHVLTIKLKRQSDTIQVKYSHTPNKFKYHCHWNRKVLFNPFEGRRTDNLPQAGNFSEAGSW